MRTMMERTRPTHIKGSCLCGAIRFTIHFPKDTDWPPQGNGICQCTMCRKHSGSLLPQNIAFPTDNVSPQFPSLPTYKTYDSGPTTSRDFCSTCGSPLTFSDAKDKNVIQINIGAFDEEVLLGEKVESEAWKDEYGRHMPRKGGWGYELGFPKYHIFAENEVKGVTDGFDGEKWLTDREGGKAFKGKVAEMKRKD
ncbi:hypothetical protein BU23DRAFT_560596 [Bimuria novae-zelandiae CBS 107.79]|uniref:CENP-V/GFA domain-containing protein n=1 Tax=Bimuria novae-zelandiae CBS 107.79 TaxID=1447943 RepID=A0A6A5USZ3_9PLEO|nr:hypothetical protein BU23DRAFT_560596 [Bimuria novae-zelandiae CBS 107.79]